jgi:heme a synthase
VAGTTAPTYHCAATRASSDTAMTQDDNKPADDAPADDRPAAKRSATDVVAIGFAQTVLMWAVAYVCRLVSAGTPSWFVLILLLACMLAGGVATGRLTRRRWTGGVYVGLISAVLNMMILGSLLAGDRPNQIVPSALLWIPGMLLIGALIGATGTVLGRRIPRREPIGVDWTWVLVCTPVVACFVLLTAGGLVTSKDAGLAVVDWPNSFGYNMFLYPLSRMTGGIYYEHAHRLLGSLLGVCAIVLTVHLWRVEPRRGVRIAAAVVLALIVFQGVLGGLRVTGHLTLSISRDDMAPSIRLAAVHGVLGQVIFATLTAIAALTSPRWLRSDRPTPSVYASTDRTFSSALLILLGVQLMLGAALRHTYAGLTVHISIAVVATMLALACGLRCLGLYDATLLRRIGLLLVVVTAAQFALGLAALIATGAMAMQKPPPTIEVVLATAHQVLGAVFLAIATQLAVWHRRLACQAQ